MESKTEKLKFPKGFLWGAATAAHQVEGGTNNDWTQWEKDNAERLAKEAPGKWQPWQKEKFPEMLDPKNYISGLACDHYHRFEEDFDLAKSLGHNAHRFSIEWSRIEPEEGKFDEKEIEHYRKVLQALKARGIEPFVTLWHWTMPLWLSEIGGVENTKFPEYFSRFAIKIVKELGSEVRFWVTLNEPTSVISNSYASGNWPPQKKNIFSALKAYRILAEAHNQAYAEIKKVNQNFQVGFANILQFVEPLNSGSFFDRIATRIFDYFVNKKFLKLTGNNSDFLAAQYYFHNKIKFPGQRENENKIVSDLGWEIYPEGIYHVLKDLKKYNLPIYVTENGLADTDDTKRAEFIKNHLAWIYKAIKEGVDVRGYFHWSLLDNFEWDKGFWPRFGLIEIDYKTLERKIRPSALEYANICKSNEIDV